MLLIDKEIIQEIKINAGSDSFINTCELLSNSKEVEVFNIEKAENEYKDYIIETGKSFYTMCKEFGYQIIKINDEKTDIQARYL